VAGNSVYLSDEAWQLIDAHKTKDESRSKFIEKAVLHFVRSSRLDFFIEKLTQLIVMVIFLLVVILIVR
jgi:hypothetical protein